MKNRLPELVGKLKPAPIARLKNNSDADPVDFASPPTSWRRKVIPSGRSSTATIRNTKRTRKSAWVMKARSRSGYGISQLVGESDSLIVNELAS